MVKFLVRPISLAVSLALAASAPIVLAQQAPAGANKASSSAVGGISTGTVGAAVAVVAVAAALSGGSGGSGGSTGCSVSTAWVIGSGGGC